ncbi:MAG: serine hydrolase [Patescibacteria group bacterium]
MSKVSLGSPRAEILGSNLELTGSWKLLHNYRALLGVGVLVIALTLTGCGMYISMTGVRATGIASSSFDENIEQKVFSDYTKEAENLRIKYNGISFFNPEGYYGVDDLNTKITQRLSGLSGNYGVYTYNIKTGEEAGYNFNQKFTMASIAKIFAASSLYANQGTKVRVGIVQSMLHASDNGAFSQAISEVGVHNIVEGISHSGVSDIDFVGNEAKPKSIGQYLTLLSQEKILNHENTASILSFMKGTTNEERLPASLPEGTDIAHKVGTWSGAYSDAGIVNTSFGSYVVVVMSDGVRYDEAVSAIQDTSRIIYEFWKIRS